MLRVYVHGMDVRVRKRPMFQDSTGNLECLYIGIEQWSLDGDYSESWSSEFQQLIVVYHPSI